MEPKNQLPEIMSLIRCFLFIGVLAYAPIALASSADVREVARLYNCVPKKIEVISSSLGTPSQTVYRVQCNMPKLVGDGSAQKAESILVRCNGELCDLLRTVPLNN